jgi:hypothetical protein
MIIIRVKILLQQLFKKIMNIQKWIPMISRSLILLILQAAKIMRVFFMEHLRKSC